MPLLKTLTAIRIEVSPQTKPEDVIKIEKLQIERETDKTILLETSAPILGYSIRLHKRNAGNITKSRISDSYSEIYVWDYTSKMDESTQQRFIDIMKSTIIEYLHGNITQAQSQISKLELQ